MKVLVTGSAGFIGSALSIALLERGDEVVGVDNHNTYYDPALKEARLARHLDHERYTHYRCDLEDGERIQTIFKEHAPERVVNLAAQPGVRYALKNPYPYVNSNVVGFLNILEACRHHGVESLVYASTSSVYGANSRRPYSEHHGTEHPLSLYAATKKANEMMAHTYSHLYELPTVGLRFFTVYGPWTRPDMALFKFTRRILRGEPIDVYNYGKHSRDFTYIDDIVDGVVRTLDRVPRPAPDWSGDAPDPATSTAPYRIYNIGNNRPVPLMDYIGAIEKATGQKAQLNLLPMQPGDVPDTWADSGELIEAAGYQPRTTVEQGVRRFVEWYRDYYQV